MADEPITRLRHDIEPRPGGVTRLTVTRELEGAPLRPALLDGSQEHTGAGGWPWILSDLKSLLETGGPLAG
jgi:hypothetical protein